MVRWRGCTAAGASELIEALALLEAAIDFSDEGDVARDARGDVAGEVAALQRCDRQASR